MTTVQKHEDAQGVPSTFERNELVTLGLPGQLSRTGWLLPADLSEPEWIQAGKVLAMVEGAIYWIVGDWWAYGESRYGDRKALVTSERWEGPSFQTCADAAWVSRRFETSRRREVVPWSFHREVAVLDPQDQDALLDECVEREWTRRELRQAARVRKAEAIERQRQPFPVGTYRVIYADPPRSYGNEMPRGTTTQMDHYPLESLDDLKAMPVSSLSEDDAVLFLWSTSAILPEAIDLALSWGFEYKTTFVWDKVRHNMGHYNSVRHELLLVCVKGSCTPDVRKLYDSVYSEERREHSRKPDHFYEVIDTLYPHGPRIELFARARREG